MTGAIDGHASCSSSIAVIAEYVEGRRSYVRRGKTRVFPGPDASDGQN